MTKTAPLPQVNEAWPAEEGRGVRFEPNESMGDATRKVYPATPYAPVKGSDIFIDDNFPAGEGMVTEEPLSMTATSQQSACTARDAPAGPGDPVPLVTAVGRRGAVSPQGAGPSGGMSPQASPTRVEDSLTSLAAASASGRLSPQGSRPVGRQTPEAAASTGNASRSLDGDLGARDTTPKEFHPDGATGGADCRGGDDEYDYDDEAEEDDGYGYDSASDDDEAPSRAVDANTTKDKGDYSYNFDDDAGAGDSRKASPVNYRGGLGRRPGSVGSERSGSGSASSVSPRPRQAGIAPAPKPVAAKAAPRNTPSEEYTEEDTYADDTFGDSEPAATRGNEDSYSSGSQSRSPESRSQSQSYSRR